jgi:hypothetical protein
MTLRIARRNAVAPFIVMDVLRAANEKAAAGDDGCTRRHCKC